MKYDAVKRLVEEHFNGQYELLKFLGEGAFSEVYLVRHCFLDDLRALKIIKEAISPVANVKDIFYEVLIATKLRHENIISIYDAGIISTFGQDDDGCFILKEDGSGFKNDFAYFIMEYVPGGDLESYRQSFIKSGLFMPVNRALDLLRQICLGLNTLHSSNPAIVHRDLKPNNILLNYGSKGEILVKLSDFGFSKEVTTGLSDLDIAGTRPFMAPESFFKGISTMTDTYALGVILYLLLTNELPYDIDAFSLDEILDGQPWKKKLEKPSNINPKIPDYLDEIIIKALAVNPNERYRDADDLLMDINMVSEKMRQHEGGIEKTGQNEVISDFRNNWDYFDAAFRVNHDFESDEDYILNDSLIKAFKLAKCEGGLVEAIDILENEIFKDYDVRRAYGWILQTWKSDNPDVRLISKAFSLNLRGDSYKLSSYCLMEAIAYEPSLKEEYSPYLDLWKIFIRLEKERNLAEAVVSLEKLMGESSKINETYRNVINVLKTYSVDEILSESMCLLNSNKFSDASALLEFAVVADSTVKSEYDYDLLLCKQNMKRYFKNPNENSASVGEDYLNSASVGEGYLNSDDVVGDLNSADVGDGFSNSADVEGSLTNLKEYHDDCLETIDYAIDLGTNDSFMACLRNGKVEIIKNHITEENYTSSAVYVDKDLNVIVGKRALNALINDQENASSGFKSNMGFSIPYKFRKSFTMFPEELSAEVLKDLRKSVYMQYGVNMEHAVITVPANSNPFLTKATNDAADLAGFITHPLLLEPVAAAIAYDDFYSSEGMQIDDEIWMIYDLGASTFKASLVWNNSKSIETIASQSMMNIGGDFFDWEIIENLLAPEIIEDLGLQGFSRDSLKYRDAFLKLKDSCEESKIKLSKYSEVDACIEYLFEGYDFKYHLTRESLKEIMEPYIKSTLDSCSLLLNECSLEEREIDRIILAGGSSLSPIVREMIGERFEIPLEQDIDPLTVVVRGAAVYAGTLRKPDEESGDDEFSIVLNRDVDGLHGRIFSLDEKFSFLGFSVEFAGEDGAVFERVDLDINGEFRISSLKSLVHDVFDASAEESANSNRIFMAVHDENGSSLEMDEKSPLFIEGDKLFIPFLNRSIKLEYDGEMDYAHLNEEFEGLASDLDYLGDIFYPDRIVEDEVLEYIEKLIGLSKYDAGAIALASAYVDYLKDIVFDSKLEIQLSALSQNIQNKLDVLENDYLIEGDLRLIADEFDSACEKRDLDELKRIYSELIESYVRDNRNSVIESVFFNLRYDGIYEHNKDLYEELVGKGIEYLNFSDFDNLYGIINQLYALDERNE